ncbi:pancreatic triacylglycerol lipase-like, partial [Argonauta hians]
LLDNEVCFGELGCFSNEGQFQSFERPINLLPNKPEEIGTKFYLYTRLNPLIEDELEIHNKDLLHSSNFSASRATKFIIHGFKSTSKGKPWVVDLTEALLKHDDYNVIIVDWRNGSEATYARAVSNGRVVGVQIALLIKFLGTEMGTSPKSMHLIGHSVGAHIAGYAGEKLTNLARISGLDPSGPYFENTGAKVRLDPTDADFVDAIHSDVGYIIGLGLGMESQVGHVDFYPNGGKFQPGCPQFKISGSIVGGVIGWLNKLTPGAKAAFVCSHKRAEKFYIESINSACPFYSYKCSNVADLNSGKCFHKHGQLGKMGFHADKSEARGKHMLKTFKTQPYCAHHYQVSISGDSSINGRIFLTLTGTKGTSEKLEVTDDVTLVNKGHDFEHVLLSHTDVGDLKSVELEYDETTSPLRFLFEDDWKLKTFKVFRGDKEGAHNPDNATRLVPHDEDLLSKSNFDGNRPTKVIIHGFQSEGTFPWVRKMVGELLIHDDYNVIVVDWKSGARVTYGRAASNTRVVGAQIAVLVNFLNEKAGNDPKKTHIIGHSLGAHTAGYAGERIANLSRISGLDPAAPYFEATGPKVRLDPTDADFVDVIHTDTGDIIDFSLGMNAPVGHVDFYPNGGHFQPGCTESKIPGSILGGILNLLNKNHDSVSNIFACSHKKSQYFYTDTINSACPFISYPCDKVDHLLSGKCFNSAQHPGIMGFHADKAQGRGKHMLETFPTAPFCAYQFQVNVSGSSTINGKVHLQLIGTKGKSEFFNITDGVELVSSGIPHAMVVKTHKDIGQLLYVDMLYEETENFIKIFFQDEWILKYFVIFDAANQKRYNFCARNTRIIPKNIKRFDVKNLCP